MTKGFGKQRESDISNEEKKSIILQKLFDNRDIVLGISWRNYLEHGIGAVIFRSVEDGEDGEKITYRPKNKISDSKDLKIVEQNTPNTSAVVFAYFGKNEYVVTTLIGPKTPPECHENLPEDLMKNSNDE